MLDQQGLPSIYFDICWCLFTASKHHCVSSEHLHAWKADMFLHITESALLQPAKAPSFSSQPRSRHRRQRLASMAQVCSIAPAVYVGATFHAASCRYWLVQHISRACAIHQVRVPISPKRRNRNDFLKLVRQPKSKKSIQPPRLSQPGVLHTTLLATFIRDCHVLKQ